MGMTAEESTSEQLASAALKIVQFEEWQCEHPDGTYGEFVKETYGRGSS